MRFSGSPVIVEAAKVPIGNSRRPATELFATKLCSETPRSTCATVTLNIHQFHLHGSFALWLKDRFTLSAGYRRPSANSIRFSRFAIVIFPMPSTIVSTLRSGFEPIS
jgi:hypothetical protein